MLALALLSTFAVIGLLCWVLFQLAVFALPFFAAVTVGLAVLRSSGNLAAALAVGLIVGITTYLLGGWAFRVTPSPLMRMVIARLCSCCPPPSPAIMRFMGLWRWAYRPGP
jgi:hypothetical protein